MNKKTQVSVIIVHYKNEKDLFECLDSLNNAKTKISLETIIVDNSENRNLQKLLEIKKYKNIKYINSPKNIGYGAGINLGVKYAIGEFLFIVNPDVIFTADIVTSLVNKISKNKKIGIISPLLYTTENKIMEQGAKELTPLRAFIKFSFIDKLLPNNPISKSYWIKDWSGKNLKMVDNVPGTALIIRKKLFNDVGGFDENFFLYFEEFDLCKRVREKGYKVCIDPASKLIHKWGTSTVLLKNKDEIFKKSRFYYFKKNYGLLNALFVEGFLSINKSFLIFFTILIGALAVRLYAINTSVLFIGDQGWFFISAKDWLVNGNFPLVGITSSHVWLHQGPVWTYIVGILFFLSRFNPIAPFYFSALVDVVSLMFLYRITKIIFSNKVAIMASFLYAFSPLVILSSRMAYHTSLIPFFVILLFYSLYKWIKGNQLYFPFSILILCFLYNFELQTIIFVFLFFLIFLYGLFKKTFWFKKIINKKILFISIFAFIIPMLPILIYDIYNGFPQTVVFAGWIFYKVFSFIPHILSTTNSIQQGSYADLGIYFYEFFRKLVFLQNGNFSLLIGISSILYLIYKIFSDYLRKNNNLGYVLTFLFLLFLIISFFVNRTPSDAYLMSLFIPVTISIGLLLDFLSKSKSRTVILAIAMMIIAVLNMYSLLSNNYFTGFFKGYGPNLNERIEVAKYMVKDSKNKTFTIIGKGDGSQFESFLMNYQYLTWYYGKEFKNRDGGIIYIVSEGPKSIKIIKK